MSDNPIQSTQPTHPILPKPTPQTQPTQPTPTPAAKSPKNTKILLFSLLGVAAAAIVAACLYFFLCNKSTPVTNAIINATKNDQNVDLTGTITIPSDGASGLSDVEMTTNIKKPANQEAFSATVALSTSIPYLGGVSLSADIISDANRNLFIKLDGIKDTAKTLSLVLDYYAASYKDIIDEIVELDGQWILISSEYADDVDLEELIKGYLDSTDAETVCFVNGILSSDFSKLYKENPFVVGSTDNLKIQKKSGDLYRLSIDEKHLAGFSNAVIKNTNCGIETVISNDADIEIPELYVEISEDKFTRFYTSIEEDGMVATADFSITYPETLEITAPKNYTNAENLITSIMSKILTSSFNYDDYFDVEDYDLDYDYDFDYDDLDLDFDVYYDFYN